MVSIKWKAPSGELVHGCQGSNDANLESCFRWLPGWLSGRAPPQQDGPGEPVPHCSHAHSPICRCVCVYAYARSLSNLTGSFYKQPCVWLFCGTPSKTKSWGSPGHSSRCLQCHRGGYLQECRLESLPACLCALLSRVVPSTAKDPSARKPM